ncbi:MAG: leucine-rich repeat-containing protein [Pseudomonas sp.]|jgi:hypothetical protein|nr:leucine-rich repeat-containing protein [Pseudomonas sp.]
MSEHLAPDASIDTLIARQLPTWMRAAPADLRTALRSHLLAQQRAHAQAKRLLGSVQALPAFAEALLSPALERQLGFSVDVRTSQLDLVTYLQEAGASLGLATTVKRHASKQSLLAAALHNFHASETVADAFSSETKIVDADCRPIALTAERFAALCRTLDIGAQYQRHLKATLAPNGPAGSVVARTLEDALRTALAADACLARLRGGLDQANYRRLIALTSPVPVVPPDRQVLKGHSLRVLGKRIEGALAFEVWSDASHSATLESIIAWVPNDPIAPLSLHASWRALSIALAGRLAAPGYAAFFERFLSRQDRPGFRRVLTRNLREATPSAPIEVDGRHEAIEGDVFSYVRRRQVDGMLAEAKYLAVPTDEEDRKARAARLEAYARAGLDLLGLASLFIPGLGTAMMGIAAVQLANEVYEGYEDWQLGDREAAMEHLFAVAEGIVTNAAGAVAPPAVMRLAQRALFVDGLAPVVTARGALRLLDPSLPGYATSAFEGVEQPVNVRHVSGQAGTLRLERSSEHACWQIIHPSREGAYSPVVHDNPAGGWRHALEEPQHWSDRGELVRRLDSETASASDEAVRFALHVTATDEDQLRRLHLEGAAAPARLRDALHRYELHRRFPTLQGAAFEAQVAVAQPAVQTAAQVLRRDFPGLTPRCANELVEHASQAQQRRLLDEQRVPLALAQQARWMLHDARLDRASAGLILAQAGGRDTEKLALGLIDAIAPWSEDVRLEIRQDSWQGALIAQSTAKADAQASVIVSRQGHYHCVDATGQLIAGSRLEGTLNEALLSRLGPLQKLLLGEATLTPSALGERLLEQANQSRELAAQALGMATARQGFRPPVRIGDGRIGYPLNGRGESSRQAFARGLRQIYPTYTDADVEACLRGLREQGLDPWNYLHDIHQQCATLRAALEAWQAEPGPSLRALRRREVATRIRRCWRRKQGGYDGRRLVIEGERVGALPSIPESVDFGNVHELILRDMDLLEVPESFLRRFANLRVLDLRHNQLTRLPGGLEALEHMVELRLGYNRLVWDVQSDQRLAALTRLERLELSGNPLRVSPDLSSLRHLRHVSLRDTRLTQMPLWPQRRPFVEGVDLRDNAIEQVRPVWSRFLRRLFVHDNPLDSASVSEVNRAVQAGATASGAQDIAHVHAVVDTSIRDHWLSNLREHERASHRALWNAVQSEPGSNDLMRFFADLARSNEFLLEPQRLTRRVWRILRACERDASVREALFLHASGPRSCADRGLLVLSQLEVCALVSEHTRGRTGASATHALLRLGRSLHRLEEVDRLAIAHVQKLRRGDPTRPVDEIEVVMAYRVNLRAALGLPEQPDYMYYASHSRVSLLDLSAARVSILTQETQEALATSLLQRDFWIAHLRQRFGHLVEEMNAPFHVRLEALEGWGASGSEQAYLDNVEQLVQEREAAERALLLRLTLEELRNVPI